MRLIACLLMIAVAAFARHATAHPHVFIDYMIEPQIENGAIVALKLRWRFDDLYSGLVIDSVDRDNDGKLSAPEIDAIAKRTLANAEKANFYAHFTLDAAAWQTDKAQVFTAEIDGDHVVYIFTLKLPAPARSVTLSAYDPEYYIEMVADKRQTTIGSGLVCTIARAPPVKTQSWGSVTPDLISCSVAGK